MVDFILNSLETLFLIFLDLIELLHGLQLNPSGNLLFFLWLVELLKVLFDCLVECRLLSLFNLIAEQQMLIKLRRAEKLAKTQRTVCCL